MHIGFCRSVPCCVQNPTQPHQSAGRNGASFTSECIFRSRSVCQFNLFAVMRASSHCLRVFWSRVAPFKLNGREASCRFPLLLLLPLPLPPSVVECSCVCVLASSHPSAPLHLISTPPSLFDSSVNRAEKAPASSFHAAAQLPTGPFAAFSAAPYRRARRVPHQIRARMWFTAFVHTPFSTERNLV